jgi:hypothetical protein
MSIPVECHGQTQILSGAPGVYPVAPEGLVGQALGSWVGGTTPLASSELVVKWGAVRYGKPCHGEKTRDHTVFGVATKSVDGSKPHLFHPTGLEPDWFIDLVNSLIRQASPNPPCQVLKDQYGAPAYSDLALQLNT